jgi:hypothetical protein
VKARFPFALAATAVLAACGKKDSKPSTDGSDFYGIQYRVPAGTSAKITDGTLPGPGGQGGAPSGVRISLVLTRPGPDGFYVEIIKTAEAVSLDGTTFALVANNVGSNMAGKATGTGWELTYDLPSGGKAHVVYADIAGGHFECSYADVNCPSPAAAEAICRSMRPAPAR